MTLEKFKWEDKLSVGVSEMDDQHKMLVEKINSLIDTLENGDSSKVLSSFGELAGFVIQHFEDEEKLMESHGFPGLEGHKLIHKNLLDQVGGFKAEIESGDLDSKKLVNFLKFWLSSHIMGIDSKYGEHINKNAA
jgi:hemerythrin